MNDPDLYSDLYKKFIHRSFWEYLNSPAYILLLRK